MKIGKKEFAIAFGAVLGFGLAGQASADVYGLSYLNIDNVGIMFRNSDNSVAGGGAGRYTFSTNQDAILNGSADPAAGNASCTGVFLVSSNCSVPTPTLSGTVQNAPPANAGVRGEGDYTQFGQVGNYSNSEAEVVEATLTFDPKTHVESISESNLANNSGQSAQANNNVLSNTTLFLTFAGGVGGKLTVSFTADVDVQAAVTGLDQGLAGASSSASMTLVKDSVTIASWAPIGTGAITTCDLGLTCVATETGPSLNNTATSSGPANVVAGSGSYSIDISGLVDGTYTLLLSTTTSTDLVRDGDVPVPGTMLLMATGLLLGARATRRNPQVVAPLS
jgi:hypothetical protein